MSHLSKYHHKLIFVQESIEQSIDLPDDYPAVVARLLVYLYTRTLIASYDKPDGEGNDTSSTLEISRHVLNKWIPHETPSNTGAEMLQNLCQYPCGLNPLSLLARIFVAADKFLLDDLKEGVLQKMEENFIALNRDDTFVAFCALVQAGDVAYGELTNEARCRKLRHFIAYELGDYSRTRKEYRQEWISLCSRLPELALDIMKRGMCQIDLWCSKCCCQVWVPQNEYACNCGLTGQCGQDYCEGKTIHDFDIKAVKCWECENTGCLSYSQYENS